MEFHPLANVFPLIEGDELKELVEDIRANGLRQPICIYEGKILDGRNRYLACRAAGVEPRCEQFPPDADPLAFVISTNLRRRHLTDKQRQHIAAELATMGRGGDRGNQHTGGKPPIGGMTTARAAELMDVSERSVERAKQVKRADPAAHEQAKTGKRTKAKPLDGDRRKKAAPKPPKAEPARQTGTYEDSGGYVHRFEVPQKGATKVDVAWLRHAPVDGVAKWLLRALGAERSAALAGRVAKAV
jgi:hypothetical protein